LGKVEKPEKVEERPLNNYNLRRYKTIKLLLINPRLRK
jgi:hypothetical protein